MKRREFIALAGGVTAWPSVGRAQFLKMPVVGILHGGAPGGPTVAAFKQGLKEQGYIEGQNVAFEYRWAEGHFERLPQLAADLVQKQIDIIAAIGGPSSALAAKAATTRIPIVFSTGGDPVKLGIVLHLNRPGGNATGVTFLINELGAKRLELFRGLAPKTSSIGILFNPANPNSQSETEDIQSAARSLNIQVSALSASDEREIGAVFEKLSEQGIDAIVVAADVFFFGISERIVALAARYRMPIIYSTREFVMLGGLASYGTNLTDMVRQQGVYAGRILKGEKPSDLPVMQPTKFELVLNLKTAKTLGLEIPPHLLATADEVIE